MQKGTFRFTFFVSALLLGTVWASAGEEVSSITLGSKYHYGMNHRPHETIVVCSDEPTQVLAKLRAFSDLVFGEDVYRILDGDSWSGDGKVTLAYFGHPISDPASNKCMAAHPNLLEYFVDKQQSARKTAQVPDGNGGFIELPVASSAFRAPSDSEGNIRLFVALCFNDEKGCSTGHSRALFGLNSSICRDYDVCK